MQQRILLLGLMGTALAHPARVQKGWKPTLTRRTVDLNQYRLNTNATYTNATETSLNPVAALSRRDTYVDTATALVKSVAPNAEFRVADQYVGTNGIAVSFAFELLYWDSC